MYHKTTSLLIPATVALLLFGTLILSASAQETATSSEEETVDRERPTLEDRGTALEERQQERSELLEERQENHEAAVEARQEVRAERQSALTEIRQQRVLNLSANISNRMEGAINRLFNIVERMEERINKLNAAGVDTTAATAKLREAAQLLAEARATLGNIDTLVFEATSSTEPKTAWQNVRTVYQEAGSQIRASHQALRESIALLKQAVTDRENQPAEVVAEDTATTTQSE